MHGNYEAARISSTVVNGVTSFLPVENKAQTSSYPHKYIRFDGGQFAHTVTGIEVTWIFSTGTGSLCAMRLSK